MFGVAVPTSCPGVPSEILNPRATWRDPERYDVQAQKLARQFIENQRRFDLPPDVAAAAPQI